MDGIYKQEDGTILIEYKGQRGKLSDWAQWRGISKTTLYVRVRAGWPVEEILRRKRFHGNPEEDGAGLQSLCWDCKHAVPTGAGNGCSWSRSFQPVEGWEAEKTHPGGRSTSYHVKRCPRFERG